MELQKCGEKDPYLETNNEAKLNMKVISCCRAGFPDSAARAFGPDKKFWMLAFFFF